MTQYPYKATSATVLDDILSGSSAQHQRPLWIGLTLSVAIPVLIPSIPLLVASLFTPGTLFIALVVGIFALILSTLSTLLIALPLVLLLRKFGHLSAIYVCLAATLVGAAAMGYTTFSLSAFPQLDNTEALKKGLNGLVAGAAFGLTSGLGLSFGSGIPFRRKPSRGA